MMKKPVVVGGINLLDTIRRNLIIRTETREFDLLAHKFYAKAYLGAFSFCFLVSLACVIVLFVGDISSAATGVGGAAVRSEEHTSELQSLMRISYAVFCLNK